MTHTLYSAVRILRTAEPQLQTLLHGCYVRSYGGIGRGALRRVNARLCGLLVSVDFGIAQGFRR